MSKPFYVEQAGTLSLGLLVGGAVLAAVASLAFLNVAFTEIGNWDWWILIIGGLLILIGALWFASYVLNVRKFRRLMEEESKASFVRKQDDAEYLAWRLPLRYEDELAAKKKHFGLR